MLTPNSMLDILVDASQMYSRGNMAGSALVSNILDMNEEDKKSFRPEWIGGKIDEILHQKADPYERPKRRRNQVADIYVVPTCGRQSC